MAKGRSRIAKDHNLALRLNDACSTGKSPSQVVKAMAAVKPAGQTNLHEALDTAFRFRSQKLDTIYVLSDGLPNLGPELTPAQKDLSDTEKSKFLSKHLRRHLKEEWNVKDERGRRVVINTIGFFYESEDIGAFLWALARENDGSFVGMSKP